MNIGGEEIQQFGEDPANYSVEGWPWIPCKVWQSQVAETNFRVGEDQDWV